MATTKKGANIFLTKVEGTFYNNKLKVSQSMRTAAVAAAAGATAAAAAATAAAVVVAVATAGGSRSSSSSSSRSSSSSSSRSSSSSSSSSSRSSSSSSSSIKKRQIRILLRLLGGFTPATFRCKKAVNGENSSACLDSLGEEATDKMVFLLVIAR
jgi:hypothetical protein